MILLLIVTILMVFSWAGFIHCVKTHNDGVGALCLFLAIIATTVSLTGFILIGNRKSEARKLQEKRDYYAELVAHVSDDMSFETVSKTISTAKNINADIERNKRNAPNVFYGSFYNPRLGEIELIDIPDLHINIKNERDL